MPTPVCQLRPQKGSEAPFTKSCGHLEIRVSQYKQNPLRDGASVQIKTSWKLRDHEGEELQPMQYASRVLLELASSLGSQHASQVISRD